MKLITKRLILREWNKKDIPDLISNINNIKVTKWLLVVPYPYKMKDAEWWIKHCKEKMKEKPRTSYEFAIELKSEKRIIGAVGLSHVDKFQGTAIIGYWLGEKYWRQKYGSEGVNAVLNFVFNKLKLRRITAGIFEGNPSSSKLIEKYGFKKEGLKRKAVRSKADKKVYDEYIYGLLREDYKK